MTAPGRRGGLGRGLGALIPQSPIDSSEAPVPSAAEPLAPVTGAHFAELPVGSIAPNPVNPRTVFDELKRIQSTDVVLPTEDGRELRLRCVVRPDAAQAALLDRLGLELPERLRIRSPILETASV